MNHPRLPSGVHAGSCRQAAPTAIVVEVATFDAKQTLVIANPAANGGRVAKRWPEVERLLRASIGGCAIAQSSSPGGATKLAEDAVRAGVRTVLSLGGDGTHHEVVNGIMGAGVAERVRLGVLPAGTGGDFCRLLLASDTLEGAIAGLPAAKASPIDLISVRYVGRSGGEEFGYGLNVSTIGIGGHVARLVNASWKLFGGKATYFLASAEALIDFKPPMVRLFVDGDDVGAFRITTVAICNGRYAGAGMFFAPSARLADGLLDVTVVRPVSLLRLVREQHRLYDGTHVDMHDVTTCFRGKEVRVVPMDGASVAFEVDGEAPGWMPGTYRIVPGAIDLLGVKPEVL